MTVTKIYLKPLMKRNLFLFHQVKIKNTELEFESVHACLIHKTVCAHTMLSWPPASDCDLITLLNNGSSWEVTVNMKYNSRIKIIIKIKIKQSDIYTRLYKSTKCNKWQIYFYVFVIVNDTFWKVYRWYDLNIRLDRHCISAQDLKYVGMFEKTLVHLKLKQLIWLH